MTVHHTDIARWSDPQQLQQAWEQRSSIAATLVRAGAVLLDLGCGAMTLERFLPSGCSYIPCDVVRRDDRTILCDFNRDDLPTRSDLTLISSLGVLEYVLDAAAFVRRLRQYQVPVIISYCPRDFSSHLDRASLGWVNHFRLAELENIFRDAGFKASLRMRIDPIQYLFRLVPTQNSEAREKAVLVLSYNNVGNFGDRLGFHLINEILPASACITHAHFEPWDAPDAVFDLVILGIGNSLFAPLLTDRLFEFLDRSRVTVGIFGTQYREEINMPTMSKVLDRLNHWYARYEDDALHYGRGRNNVTHLGDWLINAFAMSRGDRPDILNVGDEIWNNLPLDRVIQEIQSFARVHSTRLHPLLCALTSAWEVAFIEQRNAHGLVSGKFRSMLMDVFGHTWPEGQFFEVDRHAVVEYKSKSRRATDALRRHVTELLEGHAGNGGAHGANT